MSDQITVARAIEFNARVRYLLQQEGSLFRSAAMQGTHAGAKQAQVVDQVGVVELVEKSGRHQDIPTVAVPLARRWVSPTRYHGRDFIDQSDQLRMLWDPSGNYARAFAMGAGRKIDSVFVSAALGAAMTGETASGSETFDTTNFQIVHGSVGLTVQKLRLVREKMQAAYVNLRNEQLFMAIGPQQENNLLAETQVTSNDYNPGRDGVPVLVNGQLNNFLGFNFIVSNLLAKASTTRSCIAWVKSGMYVGLWEDIRTPIDWLPEKDAWQVMCSVDFGVTRLEQGRVIEVQCTEV